MIIVVMGGLGSVTGTLAASFAWALILEFLLRQVLPSGFETWRFVVYPLILLLIMLLRPKGLLGDVEMPFLRQILPALSPTARARKENDVPPAPLQTGLPGSSGETPLRPEAVE
jgi:branched-chain amino acid transport system permease protein